MILMVTMLASLAAAAVSSTTAARSAVVAGKGHVGHGVDVRVSFGSGGAVGEVGEVPAPAGRQRRRARGLDATIVRSRAVGVLNVAIVTIGGPWHVDRALALPCKPAQQYRETDTRWRSARHQVFPVCEASKCVGASGPAGHSLGPTRARVRPGSQVGLPACEVRAIPWLHLATPRLIQAAASAGTTTWITRLACVRRSTPIETLLERHDFEVVSSA